MSAKQPSAADNLFPPSTAASASAHIRTLDEYRAISAAALQKPDQFWASQAERISWFKKWDKVSECDYHKADIQWYLGGKLNASYNCVDRHVEAGYGDVTALIWEGNDPNETRKISYAELHAQVQRAANALKALGVKKGDRVCIYLQMIPELAIAVLACARIGAVHSVVFGAFSADSLVTRINDSGCKLIITQDTGVRGTKRDIPMKANADKAIERTPSVEKMLVVRRTGSSIEMQSARDIWWHDAVAAVPAECAPEPMNAEDPLFILYTSGSTGKPKGILHTTAGYLLLAKMTSRYVFDLKDSDVYWCTADVGWVTGHTYVVYGPLLNGSTVLMYEGAPDAPDFGRFWKIIQDHKVTVFYTAPTAIRAFMKWGDEWVKKHDLSSLRLLGSVGEPINPEAWLWYHRNIGAERCPIVDTWWQTETGGHMITPMPGCTPTKPGSATLPFFGVDAAVLDENGNETDHGILAIRKPWPGITQGIFGDEQRYVDTYWNRWGGKYYFPGDGAIRDKDGYLWITGRVDDVVNVSGHRIGTAELEAIFIEDAAVAESAVIGVKHDLKGQGLMAFVILKSAAAQTVNEAELAKKLNGMVDAKIGKFARPERIIFVPDLPKTRSGKIMRRLLRDISEGRELGNVSTLADPAVVEAIRAKFNAPKA